MRMKDIVFSFFAVITVIVGLTYLISPVPTTERIEQQIRSVVAQRNTAQIRNAEEDRQKETLQRLESIEELVSEMHQASIAQVDTSTNDRCVCGAD